MTILGAIGTGAKLAAHRLQELGFPADARDHGIAAQVLRDLGLSRVRLLTNNPAKVEGLEEFGVEIAGRLPLECAPHDDNLAYLRTRRDRMGHLLSGLEAELEGASARESHSSVRRRCRV